MKTIPYYRKSVYGREQEFAFFQSDAKQIEKLTGRKTIDSDIRNAIVTLSDGAIKFEECIAPRGF